MALALASCSSFVKIPPDAALDDIRSFAVDYYPSFAGVGVIEITSGGEKHSGTILLALEGGNYRLEIIDPAGRTALALAGSERKMTRVDTSTGEKKVFTGNEASVARINGVRVPVFALATLVTGSPPCFSRLVSASVHGSARRAIIKDPDMEITYSDRVERIAMKGEGGAGVTLMLGEMARGPLAPYVSTCVIKAGGIGGRAVVKWESVRQGVEFPPGFFSFEEEDELF